MLWTGRVCFGQVEFVLDREGLFWTGRVCFGQVEFALDREGLFWTGRVCFGQIVCFECAQMSAWINGWGIRLDR